MAKIKSALELALEKTESIEIDKDKIERDKEISAIRRLIGTFLSDENKEDIFTQLETYKKDNVKAAVSQSLLSSLSLRDDIEEGDTLLDKLEALLSFVLPSDREALSAFSELKGHLLQFPKHRDQLMDQLKAQYEPMPRDKEKQMRAQYGQDIHLSLENDKDFVKIANQYLDRLQKQYQEVLDETKELLKAKLS